MSRVKLLDDCRNKIMGIVYSTHLEVEWQEVLVDGNHEGEGEIAEETRVNLARTEDLRPGDRSAFLQYIFADIGFIPLGSIRIFRPFLATSVRLTMNNMWMFMINE